MAATATRSAARTMQVSYGGARFALFCLKYLRNTKGRWADHPLVLEPWQLEIFSELLRTKPDRRAAIDLTGDIYEQLDALVHGAEFEGGSRIYREAVIGLPRKNGKSTLCSALALYLLTADDEPGAEVYSAAAKKEQARIVFDQAKLMVEKSPRLKDLGVRTFKNTIVVDSTDSVYKVLAADAAFEEGLNPHGVIVDELHAHKTRELYDTLTTAQGAREEPLVVAITTAGIDLRNTICGEQFTRGAGPNPQVKDGRVVPKHKERRFYFYWRSVPKNRPNDRRTWIGPKGANPASWVTEEYLEEQRAKPRPISVFHRYYLNLWARGTGNWLKPGKWAACKDVGLLGTIQPGDEVYVGVDLGVKRDTAAIALDFPLLHTEEETGLDLILHRVYGHVWGVHPDPRKPPPAAHELIEDPEGEIDLSNLEAFIEEIAEEFFIREVVYDPWGFRPSAQKLSNRGLEMVEFPQTNERMCPASASLAAVIEERRLAHDGDEVLEAHIDASVAKEVERAWRLSKDPKLVQNAQDFAIALALAVGRAEVAFEEGVPSVTAIG